METEKINRICDLLDIKKDHKIKTVPSRIESVLLITILVLFVVLIVLTTLGYLDNGILFLYN